MQFVLVLLAIFDGVPSAPAMLPTYATIEECEAVKTKVDPIYEKVVTDNHGVYVSMCRGIGEGNKAEDI